MTNIQVKRRMQLPAKYIIVGIILSYCIYLLVQVWIVSGEKLSTSYSLPESDSALLATKYREKMTVHRVVYLKHRSPVSYLFYDSNFYLITTKVDLKDKRTLKDILRIKKGDTEGSGGKFNSSYAVFDYSRFQLSPEKTNLVSEVLVDIDADNFRTDTILNDMILLTCTCKSFAIRYGVYSRADIYFEKTPKGDESELVAMQLLFYKHDHSVYFYLLTADEGYTIPAGILAHMINTQTK